jgi:hypothetical protein
VKRRGSLYIPIIPAMSKPAPTRVELTARERTEVTQQRILALREVERLRERQLEAVRERIAALEERQAIEEEPAGDDGGSDDGGDDGDYAGPPDFEDADYELPDWDSDEFWDDWGEDIDYEIFTVLS